MISYQKLRYLPGRMLCSIRKLYKQPSYHPNFPRKSGARRLFDLIIGHCQYHWNNMLFYNSFGLDLKGYPLGRPSEYMMEDEFWGKVVDRNYMSYYRGVLQDKLLFYLFMRENGIPTPDVVAHVRNGLFFVEGREVNFDKFNRILSCDNVLFMKDNSAGGVGVQKVNRNKLPPVDFYTDKNIIIQSGVKNCDAVAKFQPNSLNTLRIVTMINTQTRKPELLSPGGLRIGSGGDVDNWFLGGVLVGMDENGRLKRYGYLSPFKSRFLQTDCVPSTGVKFEGFEMPYFEQIKDLLIKAHSLLPDIQSIGWNIALTPDGPTLIEGNEDWEIAPIQMIAERGLRKRIHALLGMR